MLIGALILSLLFDALVVAAGRSMVRRSARRSRDGRPSVRTRAVAFGGGALAIAASTILTSLATTSVQGDIIMLGMGRYEPFRTIIATDPQEAVRLREAVDRGLARPGPIRDKVRSAVQDEAQTYLKDRVAHAPDNLVVAMGRLTLASLERARRDGDAQCRSLMGGNADTAARYDGQARQQILARIVAAPFVYNPDRARLDEAARFHTVASIPGDTPCDIAIRAARAILAAPEAQSARVLRTEAAASSEDSRPKKTI